MIKHLKPYDFVNALVITGVLFILSSSLFALGAGFVVHSISQSQVEELNAFSTEIKEQFQEHGLDWLLDDLELDQRPVWNRAESLVRLDEHDNLFKVVQSGVLLLGSELIFDADDVATWQTLSLGSDQEFELLTLRVDLDDALFVTILQPRSYEATLVSSAFLQWYAFVSLPLLGGLFTLVLIRIFQQQKQTAQIKSTLLQIAKSPDSKRLPVSKKQSRENDIANSINMMLDDITDLHGTMKTMSVGIAHDLKTPLSRVANRLQSMQHDISDPSLIETHLTHASSDLNSVISTFNNLVRLNSIESGQHKDRFIKINLSDLIDDLAQSYEPVFEDSGRTLVRSTVSEVYCVGDPDLISQLICNLLENALEYSDTGAQVWVRLQSHTGSALLQIGDDGPGIPEVDQPHVFDRFYRGDISRGRPGNGLGLSIVQAICQVHGANLTLLTNQTGAVFNIEVPISK
ncbi:HAMP domain-containing histidine kinase [Pseudoalteromonas sp. SMS1]|uniref:sensor histidine kinase n=1 Tax=Pseudoalteromonas sp. SMS1 TaxID=2908894 RepID=UPI001F470C12|nr:HAMP domain-containing sensor histidine kinase [Pseudoalteromonas sp. SMS1]MCF2855875.1 HAMP domain-containing histidine kinase [Pseudoalteromonas sp. SMS1]